MKIAFIGSGKMAEALIARLPSRQVIISDIDRGRLEYLKKKYSVAIAADNKHAWDAADVVVLAVKPQQISVILEELKERKKKLVVSIAAGIPLSYLRKRLSGSPVVRVMPNNPCLIGAGISALVKGSGVTPGQFKLVENIFKLVGETVVAPEKWLDAVTGLSGSGPAYVYLVMEALIEGGKKNGLPAALAKKLALQTFYGAAKAALMSGIEPGGLREMVTSPGGTTMEGLAVLKDRKVFDAFAAAVSAASRKSKLLGRQWAN